MKQIVIIKYNAGNLRSVLYALERQGVTPVISDDPEVIKGAGKVIFPGVGEASTAMAYLKERELDQLIPTLTQPFLGICLGLQLMCTYSEENDTPCLGIFSSTVKKFPNKVQKVPHMGWNELHFPHHPLLQAVPQAGHVYFVHSYYAEVSPQTIATTQYGVSFSAMMHKDNFYAAQFHPEKSSKVGAQILRNFFDL